ncbi:MAG TPA: phosphotransferase [Dermatophilaceae bacterium]|nr:phosphotransferase [Dermatophilaceae bacterium]
MLTLATPPGLAFDPVLPTRDALLDAAVVRERLTDVLGIPVRASTRVRAKYRIVESLRVVYRLTLDGADRLVSARTFARDPGSGTWDPKLGCSWWTFPDDRRLRGLDRLLRPAGRLAGMAPGWATSQVVEYAPERSATFRALDRAGSTVGYVKAYPPGSGQGARFADRYEQVSDALRGTEVTAPRVLGRAADLLLLEEMPGLPWNGLSPADGNQALTAMGRAIATLHGLEVSRLAALPRFGRLQLGRVGRSADLVGLACPQLAERLGAVRDRLLATAPAEAGQDVLLHGDCHPKNGLVHRGRVALIDLDQAGLGPAAADIGSLLARLRLEPGGADLAGCFLQGYARIRPLPRDAVLRWHTAAALVAERAVRAVNRVHSAALAALPELIDDAADLLAKGAS